MILNRRGYDLIKKRMWKDGHLFGSEHTQYLRSRIIKGTPSLYIYHADYAVEIAAEVFKKLGRVELAVEYGLTEGDDGSTTRDHVHAIEAACPCYEVSWNAPADLDSGVMTSSPERYRHYKGFRSGCDRVRVSTRNSRINARVSISSDTTRAAVTNTAFSMGVSDEHD
jgi:hypothetical protein